MNQTWIFTNCQSTINYDSNSLNKCLAGRNITLMGDSTLRQYLETIALVMKLIIYVSGGYRKTANSAKFNIHISWRKHEMPFQNSEFCKQQEVQSSTFQLSNIANDKAFSGNNPIVVVHYGVHLQAFSPGAYRSRLQYLAGALKQLLAKKPVIKIFVKGLAPVIVDGRWFDVRIFLIYNEILYEEFADLQDHVVYLDVFSIFVANNMQLTHQTGQTMHNQIQQLLN